MAEQKTKKPRIALMSYAMDNRSGMGTALYTRRLLERMLSNDEFEFYMVHFEHVDDPLYDKAHEILIPYLKLPFATRFVRTMLFFWKYRNEKFDIIHWFQARLYPFFWFAPAKHIVVTAHGGGEVTAPGAFPFSRRMFAFVMIHFNHYIDAIIAVSEFGRQEIIEWFRASPERVYVTYPGGGERFRIMPREEAKKKIREKFGVSDAFILDVSRIEPHKNVVRLVESYILARNRGITQKLVIVGKHGGLYDASVVRSLAESAGYGDDVILISHADGEDLNALFAGADLFVFPSLNEGFGSPLVEAMSVGTPVITSNTTAPPEVVGDAAVIVNPLDVEELAREICRLLGDEKARKELAARGIERAKQFRWDKTTRETLDLYHTVLNKGQ